MNRRRGGASEHTFKFLEDTLDSARASTTTHCNVEFVRVSHLIGSCRGVKVWLVRMKNCVDLSATLEDLRVEKVRKPEG